MTASQASFAVRAGASPVDVLRSVFTDEREDLLSALWPQLALSEGQVAALPLTDGQLGGKSHPNAVKAAQRRTRVVNLMRDRGEVCIYDVQRALNVTYDGAAGILKTMVRRGEIVRDIRDRVGMYRLAE